MGSEKITAIIFMYVTAYRLLKQALFAIYWLLISYLKPVYKMV